MARHHELHRQYVYRVTRLQGVEHEAERLAHMLTEAHQAAALTLRDGYPAGGTERVSGGDVSRPVEAALLARTRTTSHLDAIDTSLNVIHHALREIHTELSQIIAPTIRPAAQPTTTDLTSCLACERTITRIGDDRPRAGYCPACATAWTRARQADPNIERFQFEQTRRTQPA